MTTRVQSAEPAIPAYDTAEADIKARIRAQDDEFCKRLRLAIELGREFCPIGVSTEPGTQRPIFVKNKSRIVITDVL